MLKKEYCKECRESMYHGWYEFNERWWKLGYIICPDDYREIGESNMRKTKDQPPTKCLFLLEYVLDNQGNNKCH